jgi:hypothetical protein
MEDRRFCIVREHRVGIVIVKDLYLVFSKATRGAKMKIARVFVSKSNILNFSSLPPIGGTLIVFCAKVGLGQEAEMALKRRELPSFLKPI